MGRIIKSIAPYWKLAVMIFLLLILQAYCDLALPQYTSNIIDVGILKNGVQHAMPDAVTKEEFETASLFMDEEELALWEESYALNDDVYELLVKGEDELNNLDEKLSEALVLNYQLSTVSEESFKKQLAAFSGMDESQLMSMSVEDISALMGMDIDTRVVEEETDDGVVENVYVDMRKTITSMIEKGLMPKENVLMMRDGLKSAFESAGSMLTSSIGAAYAYRSNKEAGIDVDSVQTKYLLFAGLKMLGIALIMAIVAVVVSFFASKAGAGIGRDLRGKLFKRVISFSNAEIDKFSTASLITRSTNDVQQIQIVSVLMLRMVMYAPIIGVGGIIKVVKTGAGMGWIIALAVLVISGFVMILMSIAMPKFKLMQKLVDRVNLVSREILTGLSVIRAFRREEREEERFDDANKALMKTNLFTNRVMTFMMPGMTIIMNGLSILIVWVSAKKIDEGTLQVGAMTAFITYAMLIVMSFLMLTAMSIMLPRAAVAANRIDEVLKTFSSIKESDAPAKVEKYNGVIEFKHVHFKYPGAEEDVLSDIDFKAEPGKTTAIIGSTGSGKTTIVNLIPRLYDVTEGSITLDGKDIREYSLHDLREGIGYVPQKGILFSGTIASNLKFGNEAASDEEVAKAARIAQAENFIEEKQYKYESHIAQGGTNVSGGQKQRLSIARAIAKHPKVFIFDDSFSALDLKTDAALRKALSTEVKDSTVIIVAQRISTILNADQIIVLDEGKIAGIGRHEELIKDCSVYQQIAKSQLSEKELNMEAGRKEALSNE